jgi:hypothetical protein
VCKEEKKNKVGVYKAAFATFTGRLRCNACLQMVREKKQGMIHFKSIVEKEALICKNVLIPYKK